MNTQLMYSESQPAPALPPRAPHSGSGDLCPRQMMICLAICMALQWTSYVMILPLFARRFAELGAGVGELGASEMAYAVAATLAAPFMGGLADRFGRRPFVLGPLAVYLLAFTGYLLAASAPAFIVLRGTAGALTAGLMPAATSMVADLAPENRRARWIGILSGGASIGWIVGPILGGSLYDRWGYSTALLAAIGMAALAFAAALTGTHETRRLARPGRLAMQSRDTDFHLPQVRSALQAFLAALPALLKPLVIALFTYFAVMFAWAFTEPRFMFFAYEDLGWSSSMLGLVMSTYGIAMMLGEFGLSRLSDDLGRRSVILAGLVLFSAQFLGLGLSHNYVVIAISFVIAGLGNALFDPALSAWILDLAPSEHQARILGLKSTVGSAGTILGPALIVLFATSVEAQAIFLVSAGVVCLTAILMVVGARRTARPGRQGLRSNVTGTQVG